MEWQFHILIWLFAVVGLLPGVLYLVGRIKDPFNPVIYFGALCFFVVGYQPMVNLDLALPFVSLATLNYFLLLTMVCVICFYMGAYWKLRRFNAAKLTRPGPEVAHEYDPSRLLIAAAVFTAVGLLATWLTYDNFTITGYLLDLRQLWIAGFVLALQAGVRSKSLWIPAGVIAAAALFHPIDRFFVYGQRGDTFRMAILGLPFLLFIRKRPSRAVVIPAIILLAAVMGTLDLTRGMVENGDAPNRIDALAKRLPEFFQEAARPKYYGSESHVYGSAMVQAVRDDGNYDCGLFIWNMGILFVPKEWVDKDKLYTHWSPLHYISNTTENAGYNVPLGAAPSGFASAFVEFWWLSTVFWGVLGYWVMGRYLRAVHGGGLNTHAYFTMTFIIFMYLVSQDLSAAAMNAIYTLVPLGLAYWLARLKTSTVLQTEGFVNEPSRELDTA